MGFLDLPGLQYFYNKYVKGLKSHAFRDPANNLTTTASGYALDARQGKALNDKVTQLNSALEKISLYNVSEVSFGYDKSTYYIEFSFSPDNKYRLFANATGIAFSRWDGSEWTELWAK